jgi:hypothetical protein
MSTFTWYNTHVNKNVEWIYEMVEDIGAWDKLSIRKYDYLCSNTYRVAEYCIIKKNSNITFEHKNN